MFSSNSSQVSSAVNYIEEVFSTYLYTGTSASQTITNNIDLSTKGGLVWIKSRSNDTNHALFDTARGTNKYLRSNATDAQTTASPANSLTAFNTNGFSLGSDTGTEIVNYTGRTYASWTFREQPKFFDVVTWTGTGSNATIAHSLGVVPGCIIVKRTDTTAAWAVYHRSLANTQYLVLNTTATTATNANRWNSTTPTSTVFSLGTDTTVNASGGTYVAYLFAHDAGGFGLTGTDNVISCGSYTGNGSTQQDITLGYEPQWVMIKRTDTTDQWIMVDNMRGFFQTADNALCANTVNAEAADVSMSGAMQPIATGFHLYNANSSVNASGGTYIYIACRRGPMKVPTLGTSVFSPNAYTGTGAVLPITGMGFPPDLLFTKSRTSGNDWCAQDKLRGPSQYLRPNGAIDELNLGTAQLVSIDQNGVTYGNGSSATNFSGSTYLNLSFRRAPGFFDEVCYTGTGSNTTKSHNLGVVPELWIVKGRNAGSETWNVGCTALAATERIILASTAAKDTVPTMWNSTYPTSTVFSIGTAGGSNANTYLYVAYFFATCAGVSKVGSYSGNTGVTVTVPCGFTGGVRFVLIKRTDSTGDWYVWDSARGIVAGNDPYLLLNSTAAEVTGTDYVDTYSAGFEVTTTAPAALNATGGTYIFLAIA